jgi:hypothetical protein
MPCRADCSGETVKIDAAYVREHIGDLRRTLISAGLFCDSAPQLTL